MSKFYFLLILLLVSFKGFSFDKSHLRCAVSFRVSEVTQVLETANPLLFDIKFKHRDMIVPKGGWNNSCEISLLEALDRGVKELTLKQIQEIRDGATLVYIHWYDKNDEHPGFETITLDTNHPYLNDINWMDTW